MCSLPAFVIFVKFFLSRLRPIPAVEKGLVYRDKSAIIATKSINYYD